METESDYFGDIAGWHSLYQIKYSRFNSLCQQGVGSDYTGLRLYAGAHVAIRFLVSFPKLLEGKAVIEIGSGIGAVGLITFKCVNMKKLVLSDAEESALSLCRRNVEQIFNQPSKDGDKNFNRLLTNQIPITCEVLRWTSEGEYVRTFINRANSGAFFDVVIGCELMYYRTNVIELLSTVLNLLGGSTGIFMHAHLFRKYEQPQQMIDFLSSHDWITFQVPPKSFISAKELADHPEWYRVHSLISGPRVLLDHMYQTIGTDWVPFSADLWENEVNFSGENEEIGGLSALFYQRG